MTEVLNSYKGYRIEKETEETTGARYYWIYQEGEEDALADVLHVGNLNSVKEEINSWM